MSKGPPWTGSGHITRDLITGSPGNLALFVPGALPADQNVPVYDFVQDGFDPGGVVKRRQISESMYMDDATQIFSSKARIPASFVFFVSGYSNANLQDNVTALAAAVDQDTWELHIVMPDGVTEYAWSCWDAETAMGFPVPTWYGVYMPVAVSTLRSPIPVAGPL